MYALTLDVRLILYVLVVYLHNTTSLLLSFDPSGYFIWPHSRPPTAVQADNKDTGVGGVNFRIQLVLLHKAFNGWPYLRPTRGVETFANDELNLTVTSALRHFDSLFCSSYGFLDIQTMKIDFTWLTIEVVLLVYPVTCFFIELLHLPLMFFPLSGELFGRRMIPPVVGVATLGEGFGHSVTFLVCPVAA